MEIFLSSDSSESQLYIEKKGLIDVFLIIHCRNHTINFKLAACAWLRKEVAGVAKTAFAGVVLICAILLCFVFILNICRTECVFFSRQTVILRNC